MYCPFFYGKQYELITIRELAPVMAEAGFVPIIVPVRRDVSGLRRCLRSVHDAGGQAVVVVNPNRGALAGDATRINELLDKDFVNQDNILRGLLLTATTSCNDVIARCQEADDSPVVLIHAGFQESAALASKSAALGSVRMQIFMEKDCGKLYPDKFPKSAGIQHVLIRNGFQRQRNRDYPPVEFFSDLHVTYQDTMDGFGDFLIVGDEYSESGGPAYAVAIHLTYLDPDMDNGMYVRHFLSDGQDTPADPGGKFGEALAKMIEFLNGPSGHKIEQTGAIGEYHDLHKQEHYPGLGYVNKLSMKHHIQTLASYLSSNSSGVT